MKFLLSVIAVCLVMITAKLYIPTVQAQECGTFAADGTYIICETFGDGQNQEENLPINDVKKDIRKIQSDIRKIQSDIKTLNRNKSGLTATQVLKLVDDKCRANVGGGSFSHPHSIRCKV